MIWLEWMDVTESELAFRKHTALETARPPLVPAEKNNAFTTRRPRTREVSSRYKSPSTSSPSAPRRCPSPNLTRAVSTPSQSVQKRAQSVDRKRPSTPPSPPAPSTPVQDSSVDIHSTSRRTVGGRLPDHLWPSTMRSLSVSFQSDIISIPVSKKEKPVTNALSDRTLRSSSNVAHKHVETPTVPRKHTPERKRSPLRGKNTPDQSENSKPVDGLHTRLIDQHRWPSRMGGKVSSRALSKSMEFVDKTVKYLATPVQGMGLSSLRRMSSSDVMVKPLQKSVSDTTRLLSLEEGGRAGFGVNSVDHSLQESRPRKPVSIGVPDRLIISTSAVRSQFQSLPSPGSRQPSPSKTSIVSAPVSRGVSPSRSRPSTPPRGVSPSRIRPSSSSGQSTSSNSVLSFIADFRKGKKGSSYIDDVHQLRLLYNRYLQWRFSNAQAEAVLYIQKLTAEVGLSSTIN